MLKLFLHWAAFAALTAMILTVALALLMKTRRWSRVADTWGPIALIVFLGLAAATVVLVVANGIAYAQTPSDVVNAVCSDDGRSVMLWALSSVAVGSVLTWSKRVMATLPKPAQHVVNFVALNWRQIAVDLGALKA